MEIKDIIKQKRLEKELTLEEVAQRVGVSPSTVSRWEVGNISNMKRDKIAKLADVLGISPAVLMGWEEPTFTKSDYELLVEINQLSEKNKAHLMGYLGYLQSKKED